MVFFLFQIIHCYCIKTQLNGTSKNKHIDQLSRIKNKEINPGMYEQLILSKEARNTQ